MQIKIHFHFINFEYLDLTKVPYKWRLDSYNSEKCKVQRDWTCHLHYRGPTVDHVSNAVRKFYHGYSILMILFGLLLVLRVFGKQDVVKEEQ